MSESKNYIHLPPTPEYDLRPVLNEEGEINYDAVSLADLTADDNPLKEENSRRYQKLREDPEFTASTVEAYESRAGWVVNLREFFRKKELSMDILSKVMDQLRERIGATRSLSLDLAKSDWWPAAVAYLEKNGFSVAGVVEGNPHGSYVGEVAKNGLIGWGVGGGEIRRINVTNLGVAMLSAPPEPPRYHEEGLHYTHVNSMAIARFVDGEWTPTFMIPSSKAAVQISNTTGIQYGQGAFEGGVAKTDLQSMEGEDGVTGRVDDKGNVTLFRVEENAKRMALSVVAMGGPEMEPEQVRQAIIETVKCNLNYIKPGQNLYIRPSVFGARGGAGANAAKEYIFAVEVWSFGNYFKSPKEGGIKLEGRRDINRPPTGADKVAVNYSPLFKRKIEAKKRGYTDMLSFDEKGNAEEVTSCSMYFIERTREGQLQLVTPPVRDDEGTIQDKENRHSLNSITRRSIKELAEAMGIPVAIRDVHYTEVAAMVGCFTVGSAAGVSRVAEIDIKTSAEDREPIHCEFKDPKAIQLAQKLYTILMGARTGTLTDPRLKRFEKWATKVPVCRKDLMPETVK